MSATRKNPSASQDAVDLLASLSVADLQARLDATIAQEKALRVLLRSAKARERSKRLRSEVARAS